MLVGWLIGFNGISTSIGYLMPKHIYTYVRFNDFDFKKKKNGFHIIYTLMIK